MLATASIGNYQPVKQHKDIKYATTPNAESPGLQTLYRLKVIIKDPSPNFWRYSGSHCVAHI